MLARHSAFFGGFRRSVDEEFWQPRKIFLGLEDERVRFLIRKHVLTELRAERRHALVDRREALLRLGRELSAAAYKPDVISIQNARFFNGQAQTVFLLVQLFDAIKQFRIQVDLVPVPRHHRRDLAFDLLQRVIRVRPGEIVEHACHVAQLAAGQLHRIDRVGEGRRFLRVSNRMDFGAMLGDGLLERRRKMRGLDPLERRHSERGGPGF